MTLGAAQISLGAEGWQIARRPGPDLDALVIGRPVAEVANLLPRLFNICRMAQATAARLALGLDHQTDTSAEVVHDHLARLFVTLRRAFDLPPMRPDPVSALAPEARLPRSLSGLGDWLAGPLSAAELGRAVVRSFPAGVGTVPALPAPRGAEQGGFENSPAGRQSDHPLMKAIEADQGRSPLWRYIGFLADLEDARTLAAPDRLADGTAVVQAARGAYALRLGQAGGRVTHVLRVTPTDHQLAPTGALALALASVPAHRPDLVSRLVALHDPCIAVVVAQVQHA